MSRGFKRANPVEGLPQFQSTPTPEQTMKSQKIYVERRDQGDYAVRRAGSQRASAVESTQAEAIARAREIAPGAKPHVERVRNTDGGHPDKWRSA